MQRDRRARRRASAVRARARADHRDRLPRPACGASSRSSSATSPSSTASARSTSRRSTPNEPMIELMRELRGRGYRMALLTNNVREWEPLWRAMLPVDEIFELVVDSAFVGMRKPEPGDLRADASSGSATGSAPSECLFVDDVEVNMRRRPRARHERRPLPRPTSRRSRRSRPRWTAARRRDGNRRRAFRPSVPLLLSRESWRRVPPSLVNPRQAARYCAGDGHSAPIGPSTDSLTFGGSLATLGHLRVGSARAPGVRRCR